MHELQLLPRVGVGPGKQQKMEIREGKVGDKEQIRLALTPNKGTTLGPKDYCEWTEPTRQVRSQCG